MRSFCVFWCRLLLWLLRDYSEDDIETKRIERLKSTLRAHVEHPFRVIKQQFGYRKVRYKGLAKNTNQLHVLFALSNLYLCRRRLAH